VYRSLAWRRTDGFPRQKQRDQTKQTRAERTNTNLAARTTPEVTLGSWERAGKGGPSNNKIRDLEVIAVGKAQSALALSETFTTASEQDTPCRNDLRITNHLFCFRDA
jgi:hypothetical protein